MPCSNLSFLVVEDHAFQRRMLVQLLQTLGARAVHSAADGQAALDVLRNLERPVDIVLSDLSMPGMDGMQFIRHLSETGMRVSLIIASALEPPLLATVVHMAEAYKVRLLGAIAKPIGAAKLRPLVELHRQQQGGRPVPEAAFSLAELAQGWTDDEFEPWFRPRVELAGGAVRAMHAVPRWRHPTRGILGPEAFMPAVEARGLKDDFAWLMLQKCAAHARAWRAAGLDLPVYVQLAFDSLADARLAERIRRTAEKEEIEARQLILGVVEPALDTNTARVLENLARLRVDGFGLAIDDFGSGAMDTERLGLVAFNEVTIRSGFVANARNSDDARAGFAVALDLARRMNLRAVADGVASKDDWQLLHQWGCDCGVGAFIALPLQGDTVPTWRNRWARSTIR